MPNSFEIPFSPTNQIWRTYKHFPYKSWYAVGELVDNSTQSFFDNQTELLESYRAEGTGLVVSVAYDPAARTLTVSDNAMGMDLEVLRRAVQLAAAPPDTSGRSEFGMGLKTACSWLGDHWAVRTKKLGSPYEYSFEIDIPQHAASDAQVLTVVEKEVPDLGAHYTVVTIQAVRGEVQRRAVGRIKQHLAEMYRRDISSGILTLLWNGEELAPPSVTVLETNVEVVTDVGTREFRTTRWLKNVEIPVQISPESQEQRTVTGWICLVAPGGRNKAGFDLLRRGRVIIGRPVGYRPERIFGLDRNDVVNQRLYGQLDLDDFPVNHLKDDFLWEQWGEDFDEKLALACAEYVKTAKETEYSKLGDNTVVPPAVVAAVNDDIADVLGTDALAQKLHLLEVVGPAPTPSREVREAEAEVLRNQGIEPRIVEHWGRSYRIYHPVNMRSEQPYVRYESPDGATIDIFINDNHPAVQALSTGEGGAERYQSHVRHCVQDAIVTHLLVSQGQNVGPDAFIQYKDHLLRVMMT